MGTTVLFKNRNCLMDVGYVLDISLAGMSISTNQLNEEYPINSFIKEIIIDVPAGGAGADGRTCLIINNAKVVRSSSDEASKTLYYGISFLHENDYVKKRIERLVESIDQRAA